MLQAYDRLVTPDELVISGPYKFVQHPIYTSYMLLFCGYCLRCAGQLAGYACLHQVFSLLIKTFAA